ncbi:hypothetical protein H6761_01985 [Candidatus Nomurabacteria bacterium]|nr:hypothetical protein [Candidatus Nomurabacteria bacterium]
MTELKKQRLFIHDHLNSRELSEIYLSEIRTAGQLFILTELPKEKNEYQAIIDQITSEIGNYFESNCEKDSETLLEEILQELNNLLPELAPQKNKNWFQKIDLVVGIIADSSIYLAGIGQIEALLISHNQFTKILENSAEINPAKIFTDIIAGQLDSGDILIISTNALFDYISREKIRLITQKYTPQTAVDQIQKLLETVPDFVTFNSLFIKNPGNHDIELVQTKTEDDSNDYSILEKTPQERPRIQQQRTENIKKKQKEKVKTKLVFDKNGLQNIKSIQKLILALNLAKIYFSIIHQIFAKIFSYLKSGYLFIFSSRYRRQSEDSLLEKTKETVHKKVNWFSYLTWKKKILIIALLVVILIFLQGLVFLTQKKAANKQELSYQQNIQSINNTLNEVEASLIYNDEKRAEELLLNIQKMLDTLNAQSQEQETEIAEVKEQTARLINKIRHINYVSDPLELFDLNALNNSQQIVQKEGSFYLLDQDALYLLKDNAVEKISDFPNGQTLADWPKQNKLILSDDQKYYIFNLDNQKIESFEFTKNSGNTKVQDMAIYSNNLYVLDDANSQIFKYPERGSSFSNGSSWLKEEIDLKQAYSLAIDGDLYLTLDNGEIKKLRKGKLETFSYQQPHPVIGQKAIIKTFAESELLYLIDPDNQRVIIFDKEGKIKDQYTSPKFDSLVDLAIDSEEKAIYLLSGNHLYLLAIN